MRRLLRFSALLLLALVVAGALLPWWLGTALQWVGPGKGLEFRSFERMGYGRFALTEVVYRRAGVIVRAGRVEADSPLIWLAGRLRGKVGPLRIEHWSVENAPLATPPVAKEAGGWMPLRARVRTIKEGLQRWLPSTQATHGRVTWGPQHITVALASWEPGGTLDVSGFVWHGRTASARLEWPTGDAFDVTVRDRDGGLLALALTSRAAMLTGTATLWDNPVSLSAVHADRGWLPREARIDAPRWVLPAELLRLAPAYTTGEGSLTLSWLDGGLSLAAEAHARPATQASGNAAPPLHVKVRAQGDQRSLRVDQLDVLAPGVTARLTQPLLVAENGAWTTSDSRFTLSIDLAEQPWIEARGRIEGELHVERSLGAGPRATFRLRGADLAGPGWDVDSLETEARLRWPRLDVISFSLQRADGTRLNGGGAADLQSRTFFDVKIDGEVTRPLVARWLPEALTFDTVQVAARLQGPFLNPVHEGRLAVDRLTYPPLAPLEANLTWKGVGRSPPSVDLDVVAGESTLTVSGSFGRDQARLSALRWRRGATEQLALQAPVLVQWGQPFRVEPFTLQGAAGSIGGDLDYAAKGGFGFEARDLSASAFADFLPALSGQDVVLKETHLRAAWDDGPMEGTGTLVGRMAVGLDDAADVSLTVRGGAEGWWIDEARVSVASTTALSAKGRLPLTVRAFPALSWKLDEDGPLELDVRSGESEALWRRVSRWTGLDVLAPHLYLKVGGTWRRPSGEASLQAAQVSWSAQEGGPPLPAITGLIAQAKGDGEQITLDSFQAKVAGQDLQASLAVKMPAALSEWRSPVDVVAKSLRGSLRLSDADLSAFALYLPGWFGPGGRLSLDLTLAPQLQLSGVLQVQDATSRPLGALGVVRGINAELRFSGREVEVVRWEGKSGGQPVAVKGKAAWTKDRQLALDLSLTGEHVPLVRDAGLLIRSDLALRLKGDTTQDTHITGTVRLHDSLVLSDVRSLIPSGGSRTTSSRRAPYFSIQAEPAAQWKLDVDITGPRFLRLRTPLFSGLASTRLRLTGTLREPRAVGEVTLDEGAVTLPFATFRVQQGAVSLTEANPFDPQIAVTATGRRLGYDLRLEVAGSVASPSVNFSSSPPLDSERVLLLVMAGESPEGEINYSGQQRFVRLGAYLGQSFFSRISADPARAERFALTSGERVSRQGRETYAFSYPLDDRWALVGEYDEFDDYNLGVKWRIFRDPVLDDEPPAEKKP